ncbi:MAG: hypothetical protein BWY76_01042 [bacterium ADurb.Bin429]|nr:MAG: hypothetical protein BWY76_01042 [bacterium ADurb.Bin429]
MTLYARWRRWLLQRSTRSGAGAEEILERVSVDAALRLQDARAEIQLCAAQESRLAALETEEIEREANAVEMARRHLARHRIVQAREAAARAVRARQHAGVYRAQRAQMYASRRRLEELAEAMTMKLALLEHQRQLLQARRQLALARDALTKGLDGEISGRLAELGEAALTEELTAEAYQELMADEASPVGETVEQLLDRLRRDLPPLPGGNA